MTDRYPPHDRIRDYEKNITHALDEAREELNLLVLCAEGGWNAAKRLGDSPTHAIEACGREFGIGGSQTDRVRCTRLADHPGICQHDSDPRLQTTAWDSNSSDAEPRAGSAATSREHASGSARELQQPPERAGAPASDDTDMTPEEFEARMTRAQEGAAERSATGLENQGGVTAGRSIRPPSAEEGRAAGMETERLAKPSSGTARAGSSPAPSASDVTAGVDLSRPCVVCGAALSFHTKTDARRCLWTLVKPPEDEPEGVYVEYGNRWGGTLRGRVECPHGLLLTTRCQMCEVGQGIGDDTAHGEDGKFTGPTPNERTISAMEAPGNAYERTVSVTAGDDAPAERLTFTAPGPAMTENVPVTHEKTLAEEVAAGHDVTAGPLDDDSWLSPDHLRKATPDVGVVDFKLYEVLWHEARKAAAPGASQDTHERDVLIAMADRYEAALRSIRGPADTMDPFMEKYRAAGGGYSGLQAIAEAALKLPDWMAGLTERHGDA